MSVELTGNAVDMQPVKPQQSMGKESTSIKEQATSRDHVSNKAPNIKTAEDAQNVQQLNKKEIQEPQVKKEEITTPQLENVAKQLQEFIGKMNRNLEFFVDEDSGRDVIKVIDKDSGDVIKQYPSEEVLSLVSKLSEATGNFVDSKI